MVVQETIETDDGILLFGDERAVVISAIKDTLAGPYRRFDGGNPLFLGGQA
jgi:hypothetical protein